MQWAAVSTIFLLIMLPPQLKIPEMHYVQYIIDTLSCVTHIKEQNNKLTAGWNQNFNLNLKRDLRNIHIFPADDD